MKHLFEYLNGLRNSFRTFDDEMHFPMWIIPNNQWPLYVRGQFQVE